MFANFFYNFLLFPQEFHFDVENIFWTERELWTSTAEVTKINDVFGHFDEAIINLCTARATSDIHMFNFVRCVCTYYTARANFVAHFPQFCIFQNFISFHFFYHHFSFYLLNLFYKIFKIEFMFRYFGGMI